MKKIFNIDRAAVEKMIAWAEKQSDDIPREGCSYSAPCVVGSAFPPAVIDHVTSTYTDGGKEAVGEDSCLLDNFCIGNLIGNRYANISIDDDVQLGYLQRAQGYFDGGNSMSEVIDNLRKAIGTL